MLYCLAILQIILWSIGIFARNILPEVTDGSIIMIMIMMLIMLIWRVLAVSIITVVTPCGLVNI